MRTMSSPNAFRARHGFCPIIVLHATLLKNRLEMMQAVACVHAANAPDFVSGQVIWL